MHNTYFLRRSYICKLYVEEEIRMARIGVEGTLSDVKAALMEMGHEVVDLKSEADVNGCDCCIISGQDKDVMGMADTTTDAPVINAQGQTAEEIVQMVSSRLI